MNKYNDWFMKLPIVKFALFSNIGAIICYYPDTFKLFLNSVEKLGIGSDILSMQNDQGKTCLHLLSEHGTTKDINDFVPLLIRLGMSEAPLYIRFLHI